MYAFFKPLVTLELSYVFYFYREWRGIILGPPNSPYEGFKFILHITVGQEYPMVPPAITFITKVFHPNVHYDSGEVKIKKAW